MGKYLKLPAVYLCIFDAEKGALQDPSDEVLGSDNLGEILNVYITPDLAFILKILKPGNEVSRVSIFSFKFLHQSRITQDTMKGNPNE